MPAESLVLGHQQLSDSDLTAHINMAEENLKNMRYQLTLAECFLRPLEDERKLRDAVGGWENLKEFRRQDAIRKAKVQKSLQLNPAKLQATLRAGGHLSAVVEGSPRLPGVFFLGDAHTTHTTKSQLRKNRKAAKLQREADELAKRIRAGNRKKR